MKRLSILATTLFLVLTSAPAALARAEAYYTVMCDGVAYESVDARAVDLGGKDNAVALFSEKLGVDCRLAGPFGG